MPPLLTTMRNTRELVSGEVYLLSALAALQKVVETLPHFISPYLEGVLSQVRRRPQQGRKSQTRSLYLCPGFSIWQGESYSERRAAAHQLRASLTSVVPPVQS